MAVVVVKDEGGREKGTRENHPERNEKKPRRKSEEMKKKKKKSQPEKKRENPTRKLKVRNGLDGGWGMWCGRASGSRLGLACEILPVILRPCLI